MDLSKYKIGKKFRDDFGGKWTLKEIQDGLYWMEKKYCDGDMFGFYKDGKHSHIIPITGVWRKANKKQLNIGAIK